MRRPPPDELTEVLRGLADWQLTSYKYWAMGWVADVTGKRRHFQLVSDRGYIDVYEFVDGKPRQILPPEDQRVSIRPSQVRALLANALARSPDHSSEAQSTGN